MLPHRMSILQRPYIAVPDTRNLSLCAFDGESDPVQIDGLGGSLVSGSTMDCEVGDMGMDGCVHI